MTKAIVSGSIFAEEDIFKPYAYASKVFGEANARRMIYTTDGNKMEDAVTRPTKKTSTSTPVPAKKTLMSSLSSPQKMIRKKATEARNRNNLSDDDDIEEARQERVKKPKKTSPPDNAFKDPKASPASGSQTISFSVTDPSALDSAQFKEALETLKSIGIVQCEPAIKKRLSDQSTLSLGEDTTSKNI